MYALKETIFICAARRTAIGSFGGTLSTLSAAELGTEIVKAVIADSGASADSIDAVLMGTVIQAGTGQAPARQVVIGAGLAQSTQAMTVNKVCSSGLYSVMLAANQLELGQGSAIIAGGMESMSNAPYLLPSLRNGARLGDTKAVDSLLRDGLLDVYNDQHMGNCAELCAREKGISRDEQDTFALESYRRANEAIASGAFKAEIAPLTIPSRKGDSTVDTDEEPGKLKAEKVPSLRPVFEKDGTVTAANASSLSDGAAAMIVCTEAYAHQHSLRPLARVVAQGWHGQDPQWFTTAPVGAVENVLRVTGKRVDDVDLFELNEAFSVVALACGKDLGIPAEKLNVTGGAVALGHPLGATGARILTTLIHGLIRENKSVGIASLCNGGGEATALMVEQV